MAKEPMNLRVRQEPIDGGTRRIVRLENIQDERSSLDIFFDMVGELNLPLPNVLDGFVVGIIFYAMRLGQDVQVHGAMSLDSLRNLNEFQEAWSLWRPNVYKKVAIIPDHMADSNGSKADDAIAAFSGGVDSFFTVLRHALGKHGRASYPLHKSVLMVHGFDVPLNKPEQLDALKSRTSPLMQELKLNLRVIRTNLRELDLQRWEDSFLSQLSCCLHNYSHEFKYGLTGSSEPYNGLVLPLGSNPATDYLLSGSFFQIVHDGAGYSRTQKVEEIAKNITASKVLKVCWEGKQVFRNCGVCEKCMRTRLNFLAVGVSNPECFETPTDTELIKTIKLNDDAQCAELKSIIKHVRDKGLKFEWMKDLQIVVDVYERPSPLLIFALRAKIWAWRAKKLAKMIKNNEWRRLRDKLLEKL